MSRAQFGSRLYVQAIFAVAAAVALSTSACGKQDGASPVAANTKTAPDTANTAAVGTVAGTKITSRSDSELDKDSATSSSYRDGLSPGEQIVGAEPDPMAKPIVASPSVESVIYYDPNGLTPDQIFAKKIKVDQAGAFLGESVRSDIVSRTGDELFYTGAGQDNLRDHLYTLVNDRAAGLSDETRAGDKRLAQTIQLSNFNVDWSNRRAELNFRLERIGSEGRLVKTAFTLQGPIDNLARFEVGSLVKMPFLLAQVECLDISGGCQTVHIRVQNSSGGRIETAHLIARHTNATLYIEGQAPGVAKNAEYDRLMSILLNTVDRPRGQNVVEKLTMTTSETIGGASNFAVTMKMRLQDQYGRTGGDTLEVTGPLAKPRNGSDLNIGVNVSPALTVINGEIVPTTAIGTQGRIVDVVREARLLKNDARGNLQVELTVRSAAVDAQEDKILLTVARIHTPTATVRIPMQ